MLIKLFEPAKKFNLFLGKTNSKLMDRQYYKYSSSTLQLPNIEFV